MNCRGFLGGKGAIRDNLDFKKKIRDTSRRSDNEPGLCKTRIRTGGCGWRMADGAFFFFK